MIEPLYFAQISDTHIGDTRDYVLNGHVAWDCTAELIHRLNNLPMKLDFVVHTGDVTTNPTPQAYSLACDLFEQLKLPVYYVAGNHDSAEGIRAHLTMPSDVQWLSEDQSQLVYRFERKGVRFLVLDGRASEELTPRGLVSDEQIDLLEEECQAERLPLVVFIHFPLLPLDSVWLDRRMTVVNGRSIHQILLQAKHRLRGVFSGHIHQPLQVLRDGLLYVSGASAVTQFGAWPHYEQTHFDLEMPPGFNLVKMLPDQTIVRQHTFPRP